MPNKNQEKQSPANVSLNEFVQSTSYSRFLKDATGSFRKGIKSAFKSDGLKLMNSQIHSV